MSKWLFNINMAAVVAVNCKFNRIFIWKLDAQFHIIIVDFFLKFIYWRCIEELLQITRAGTTDVNIRWRLGLHASSSTGIFFLMSASPKKKKKKKKKSWSKEKITPCGMCRESDSSLSYVHWKQKKKRVIDIVIEVAIFFRFKSSHVSNASVVILARFCEQLVRKI